MEALTTLITEICSAKLNEYSFVAGNRMNTFVDSNAIKYALQGAGEQSLIIR